MLHHMLLLSLLGLSGCALVAWAAGQNHGITQKDKAFSATELTVKPGDTSEHLASRMATSDRALDRFLVLNGLQPGQALKPGDQVKLVVE